MPGPRVDPDQGRAAVRAWAKIETTVTDCGNQTAGPGPDPAAGSVTGAATGAVAGPVTGPVAPGAGAGVSRAQLALAVRFTLQELAARYPGGTCEVRVPPFGVIQCLPGPRHTRGTPPNVVETDATTWLRLATGMLSWAQASGSGALVASGERADLSDLLPLRDLCESWGTSSGGGQGPGPGG